MNEKPEALRLADDLETHVRFGSGSRISRPGLENIVTTLRRQHAEIERLTATAFQAQNAAIDLSKKIARLKAERDEAVKAGREACAKVIEAQDVDPAFKHRLAAAIRARGEVPR